MPQGSGTSPKGRHNNISAKTSEYVFWAKKASAPGVCGNESPLDSLKRPAADLPADP